MYITVKKNILLCFIYNFLSIFTACINTDKTEASLSVKLKQHFLNLFFSENECSHVKCTWMLTVAFPWSLLCGLTVTYYINMFTGTQSRSCLWYTKLWTEETRRAWFQFSTNTVLGLRVFDSSPMFALVIFKNSLELIGSQLTEFTQQWLVITFFNHSLICSITVLINDPLSCNGCVCKDFLQLISTFYQSLDRGPPCAFYYR